ncbi:MAG: hypothetical protein WC665_03825 [Sulfurimonas sp.]|jgi:hypothetical protein
MTFIIKGKIIDCVELPQYIDKVTKEKGEKQFITQVIVPTKMKNGNVRKDLVDIKIDESKFNEYHSKIGKDEEFEISLYSKSSITLKAV